MGSTLQQMRSSIRQLIAVALAITISVGFVATVLQVGGIIKQSTWDAIAAQYNGADAIVTSPNSAPLNSTTVDKVRGVSGVATAEGRLIANASLVNGTRAVFPTIAPIPNASAMRDAIRLDEGRLPTAAGEIVILKDMSKQLEATVGTQAVLNSFDTGVTTPVTIVGIIDSTTQFAGPNTPQLYALASDVKTWATDESYSSILITANAETAPSTVIKRVQEALSSDYAVRSRNQQADEMLRSVTDGIDVVTFGLLGFAIVALFVAGLVITNTFAILVAQRTRQLALLRCVGATRSQIKRGVMTEAIVLSVVASVIGLLLGIGVIQAGVRLVDRTWPTWGIATNPALNNQLFILPLVLGIAATALAAWGPARRATQVAPLAALRPEQPEVFRSTVTLRRLIVTLMLIASGGLTMLGGIALSLASTLR